ncbi:MAG TPA: hypothetical protein VGX37_00420 [Allosphingosinicella sp.]|nr:hypothetical protein [Allosphingosinicella sp.]
MSFRYSLLAAAAAAFAFPAFAQTAGVEAGVDVGIEAAGAKAEVQADVQAQGQAAAPGENEANAETAADAGTVTSAGAEDVRAGAVVQDPQGGLVGRVESVDAEGAVVSTGSVRAKLPLSSFGKNGRGLVISMTRAEFEAAVAARNPS